MSDDRALTDPDPHELSTPQLISRASEQTAQLIRSEMQLARADLKEAARHAGLGVGLFGTAGVLALYGLGALIATLILALALIVPAWLAALTVTLVLFATAGAAALMGKQQVSAAPPPLRDSIDSVEQDVRTVKEHHDVAH